MEGMADGKPFKMKGHTLPGINQRSEGNTDMPDGRSASSAFQYRSPAKEKTHGKDTDWEHTHKERVAHGDGPDAHNIKTKTTDDETTDAKNEEMFNVKLVRKGEPGYMSSKKS